MLKRINDVLDWIYPIDIMAFIGILFVAIGPGGMCIAILMEESYGGLNTETSLVWRWMFGSLGILAEIIALIGILAFIRYPFLSNEAKIALAWKNRTDR